MSRLFVDLTDLEKWPGFHGGIQRVVYGISKEFYLSGDNVYFVAFDKETKMFYETSFEPIYERVENLEKITSVPVSSRTAPSTVITRLKAVIPSKLKAHPSVRRIKERLKKSEAVSVNDKSWVDFQNGDTVLVMGMSWESPGIQLSLAELKRVKSIKVVQIVYDLIICLYPHLHHPANIEPYTKNMIEVIKNSDLLLPISKSSEKDLKIFAKQQGMTVPSTNVIRLSDTSVESGEKAIKPSADIAQAFIACVGTVEVRKNHTLIYYVYKLAAEKGIKLPQLIIVGGRGWYAGDLQRLLENDPAIKNKILILSDVEDKGLKWVYKNCLFTVYPSMYEGWGLPVAESLAHGKLCLASNSSSIPEIAGDLIEYFSPYSADECLASIVKYVDITNRQQREELINRKYRRTSWGDTANQIIEAMA